MKRFLSILCILVIFSFVTPVLAEDCSLILNKQIKIGDPAEFVIKQIGSQYEVYNYKTDRDKDGHNFITWKRGPDVIVAIFNSKMRLIGISFGTIDVDLETIGRYGMTVMEMIQSNSNVYGIKSKKDDNELTLIYGCTDNNDLTYTITITEESGYYKFVFIVSE